jgi:hypothetical protein
MESDKEFEYKEEIESIISLLDKNKEIKKDKDNGKCKEKGKKKGKNKYIEYNKVKKMNTIYLIIKKAKEINKVF